MPLIVEAIAVAGVAYLLGLVLAYLIMARRRSAQDRRW